MTFPLRLGNEEFRLDVGDAAEVQRAGVMEHRQAALNLARRRARKASVTGPMSDGCRAGSRVRVTARRSRSPPPSQSQRTTPMTAMTKIRIGDASTSLTPTSPARSKPFAARMLR